MPTAPLPPALERDRAAACLGAPEGGLGTAPALEPMLAAVPMACPADRVFLSPGLLPRWAEPLVRAGARVQPLEGLPEPGGLTGRDQVWLDLGEPGAPDPETAAGFLDRLGTGPEPPLAVLLRDDQPGRARSLRLAVDRPGRVLLLRLGAEGGAYALAHPDLLAALARVPGWPSGWNLVRPLPGTGPALLALDVDGVLIDPGRAFLEAVARTLAELAPGLPWTDEHFRWFKRIGGFNNDFRLVAGALALAEGEGFGALPGAVGVGFPHLEPRIRDLEPRCREALRRHYAGVRPLVRPLVSRRDLAAFPGPIAVFTGRPPQELEDAFAVLGFRLPGIGDTAPHLRKPRPEGLVQLADGYRAGQVLFVGDSRDDATALEQARALRPDVRWTFGAVGPERARFVRPGDRQAEGLVALLAGLGPGGRP